IFSLGAPVLGICYGMQLMMRLLGGEVVPSGKREYGPAELVRTGESMLLDGLPERQRVWMSHGDRIAKLAPGVRAVGTTSIAAEAGAENPARGLFAIQFHPEVAHTEHGTRILRNFLFNVARIQPDWTMAGFLGESVEAIRRQVGNGRIVCALSGGVDS